MSDSLNFDFTIPLKLSTIFGGKGQDISLKKEIITIVNIGDAMTQDEACIRIINNDNVYAIIDDIYESFESITCVLCKDCIYWKPELIPHGSNNGYKKNSKSCTFLSINTSQYFGCIQGKKINIPKEEIHV